MKKKKLLKKIEYLEKQKSELIEDIRKLINGTDEEKIMTEITWMVRFGIKDCKI